MNTKIKKFLFLNLYYLLSTLILLSIGAFVPIPWTITSFGITDTVNKALIKSKVAGVLSEIYGKEGNAVKSGQLLAVIKDIESEIFSNMSINEFELIKIRRKQAKYIFEKGFISENEFKHIQKEYELKKLKKDLIKNYEITSPIDGILLSADELELRVGDKVFEGTVIASVADINSMVMKLNVEDHKISKINVGDDVRCFMTAFPSVTYGVIKGKVKKILPQAVVLDKGVFFVVIVSMDKTYLEKSQKKFYLKPGMSGNVKIIYERTSFFNHIFARGLDVFYTKSKI